MSATAVRRAGTAATAGDVRTLLELTRLLDDIEPHHPEVSAPLRLTLLRAHREHEISWLDPARFRAVVDDLTGGARPAATPAASPAETPAA